MNVLYYILYFTFTPPSSPGAVQPTAKVQQSRILLKYMIYIKYVTCHIVS